MIDKYSDIEKVIFFPYRWEIMSMIIHKENKFKVMLKHLNIASGHLGNNLQKLKLVGAIEDRWMLDGRRHIKYYVATNKGRKAFMKVLNRIHSSIE